MLSAAVLLNSPDEGWKSLPKSVRRFRCAAIKAGFTQKIQDSNFGGFKNDEYAGKHLISGIRSNSKLIWQVTCHVKRSKTVIFLLLPYNNLEYIQVLTGETASRSKQCCSATTVGTINTDQPDSSEGGEDQLSAQCSISAADAEEANSELGCESVNTAPWRTALKLNPESKRTSASGLFLTNLICWSEIIKYARNHIFINQHIRLKDVHHTRWVSASSSSSSSHLQHKQEEAEANASQCLKAFFSPIF